MKDAGDAEYTVTVDYPIRAQLFQDLLITAFEGGSNYWISSVHVLDDRELYELRSESGGIVVLYSEDDDGSCNSPTPYSLTIDRMIEGTRLLAKRYPRHFKNIVASDFSWDADTADAWLQLVLLGEVVFG